VDFRNAIIVMTSNVGADVIKRGNTLGFDLPRDEERQQARDYEEMRKKVMEQLRRAFRPEFLNRVSATIVFKSLTREEIMEIVDLELNKVRERLSEHALILDVTDAAKAFLGEKGYDPEYGARPLRRVITNLVEDRLSDGILAGTYKIGSTVHIDVLDGELSMVMSDPGISLHASGSNGNGNGNGNGHTPDVPSISEGEMGMATNPPEIN